MNPIRGSWRVGGPLALIPNTAPSRTGAGDPTGFVRDNKVWRAGRWSTGPASLSVWLAAGELRAEAWGDGAAEALAAAPAFAGLLDDAAGFDASAHPLVHHLHRSQPGLRLGRTGALFDAGVRAVLGQKVTGLQAKRSFRALVLRAGERAPLPTVSRRPLWVPPTPSAVLRALAGHGSVTLGIDATRAAALRELALVAASLESLAAASDAASVRSAMERIPGIGVWTAAETTFAALGDQDAVSFGDFHLKNTVTFALTGAPRGTDEEMAELLEPFRPHRARAVRLIELSGVRAPRYGPRMDVPAHVPSPRP